MNAPRTSRLSWYARRMARMSPAEVSWRVRDQALQVTWARRQVHRTQTDSPGPPPGRELTFAAVLPPDSAALVPASARAAVLEAADRLLKGEWDVLGVERTDLVEPDWFTDPVTGRRSDPDRYAFRVDHRSAEQTGNIKQVWEISRLQHLTLLAAAWFLSHEEAYADRVASQLRSWWRENPFLSGVNWTSGIELGIRLISLTWIRRLLDEWPGVAGLFEHDWLAVRQIRWHQQYLAAFRSRGSSANNHVIAEAAGQLVASCAFPWFPESEGWRRTSAALLERELVRNTFPSGIGRELASDYQCFVAELGFLAAVEAEASGRPVSPVVWERLAALTDSAAALVDERLRPPRQGDSDDGRGLLLDAPAANRWPVLLALGEALIGRLDWWPPATAGVESSLAGAWRAGYVKSGAGPLSGRRGSPMPGSPCFARPGNRLRRSGAGVTAARTDFSASPRTRTPTPCRWKSATGALTSWLTRVPTAITATLPGVRTSARPSRTTPPSSAAGTSPARADPFSGSVTRRPGKWKSPRAGQSRSGPPNTTATPVSIRLCGIAARSGLTVRRGASTLWTSSKAAATISAWPFIAALRLRRNLTRPARTCAGPAHPSPARRALNCPASYGGACTEGRLTRSWAGTRMAWDGGRRRSP